VPWAINQLYWRHRPVYDRLLETGAALRAAQIASLEGKKADVRRAGEAHRKALADAVKRATDRGAAQGSHPAADALSRMLEALSLAAEPPERAGRFTNVVAPAGFEALTGVKPQAPAPAPATPKRREGGAAAPARAAAERKEQEAQRKQKEAQRKQKEARIEAAERTLERARAAETTARFAIARAEREVRAAEEALARLKEG
jgi:hypothetical protein